MKTEPDLSMSIIIIKWINVQFADIKVISDFLHDAHMTRQFMYRTARRNMQKRFEQTYTKQHDLLCTLTETAAMTRHTIWSNGMD